MNPLINAVTVVLGEQVLEAAKAADRAVAGGGDLPRSTASLSQSKRTSISQVRPPLWGCGRPCSPSPSESLSWWALLARSAQTKCKTAFGKRPVRLRRGSASSRRSIRGSRWHDGEVDGGGYPRPGREDSCGDRGQQRDWVPPALGLARAGARVVVAVRDEVKGKDAIRRLQAEMPDADLHLGLLDLADLSSIHRFAAQVLESTGPPELLVNSAGVMGVPQRRTTKDGFELQIGTNHLGHFALTGLLLRGMLTRSGARVVTVSSLAHEQGRIRFDDLQGEQSYGPWTAYSQSKLANLLFAFELDRQARARGLDLLVSRYTRAYRRRSFRSLVRAWGTKAS